MISPDSLLCLDYTKKVSVSSRQDDDGHHYPILFAIKKVNVSFTLVLIHVFLSVNRLKILHRRDQAAHHRIEQSDVVFFDMDEPLFID